MSPSIRVVAPFRPFPPESDLHRDLADFDWLGALRMLVASAARYCYGPVHALTDVDTDLPVPALRYVTQERRLMLWTLEVCCRYLESSDFDRDTVMLDVDQLVCRDLARIFPEGVDLGILMRPTAKHTDGEPLLNGVQFWAVCAKDRLAAFYRGVLARAQQLSEAEIRWGADTIALRQALEPMALGMGRRGGLTVAFLDAPTVIEAWTSEQMAWLTDFGQLRGPSRPIVDFRWKRKRMMPAVYRALFGALP